MRRLRSDNFNALLHYLTITYLGGRLKGFGKRSENDNCGGGLKPPLLHNATSKQSFVFGGIDNNLFSRLS